MSTTREFTVDCEGIGEYTHDHDYFGKLVLTQTINQDLNQSTIDWAFGVGPKFSGSNWAFSYQNEVTVIINGTTLVSTKSIGDVSFQGFEAWQVCWLASGSITVPHNADGSKTLSVYARYKQPQTSNNTLKSVTVDTSYALDSVNSFSVVSLNRSSAQLGTDSIVVYTNRRNSGNYHTVSYSFDGDDTRYDIAYNVQDSYTWTPNNEAINTIATKQRSGSDINVRVRLFTYNSDGTYLGQSESVVRFVLTGSLFTPSVSVSDIWDSTNTATSFGVWVRGISRAAATVTSSGKYNSWITNTYGQYYINGSPTGSTFDLNSIPVIPSSGAVRLGVTVIDSRGIGAFALSPNAPSVLYWDPPSIVRSSAVRSDSVGNINSAGDYIRVDVHYRIYGLENRNAKSLTILYRANGTGDYISRSVSLSGKGYDDSVVDIFPADINSTYEVRIYVADYFTQSSATTATYTVPKSVSFVEIVADSANTKVGMGIAAPAEHNRTIRLGWPLYILKQIAGAWKAKIVASMTGIAIYNDNGQNTVTIDEGGFYVNNGGWQRADVTHGGITAYDANNNQIFTLNQYGFYRRNGGVFDIHYANTNNRAVRLDGDNLSFYDTSGNIVRQYGRNSSSAPTTTPTQFGGAVVTGGTWSGGGSVTPPAGFYWIDAQIKSDYKYDAYFVGVRILVDGSEVTRQTVGRSSGGGSVWDAGSWMSCSWVTYLNGSQSISVQGFHSNGAGANVYGHYNKIF